MPPANAKTAAAPKTKLANDSRKRARSDETEARPAKKTNTGQRKIATSVAPKSAVKKAATKTDTKTSTKTNTKKATSTAPKATTKAATSQRKPTVTVTNTAPTTKLQVYAFGEGSAGELGLGPKNSTEVKAPRPNPNLAGVVDIATGGMHAAALTSSGKIITWGINDQGTLGRDTTWDGGVRDADKEDSDSDDDADLNPQESTPAEIPARSFPPNTKFVQVAAGDSTTLGLTTDGHVYGWGTFRDANGIYGFTLDPQSHNIVQIVKEPMLIPGLANITSICTGSDFALALDNKGVVYAWGCGQQNELGHRLIERRRAQALLPTPLGLSKRIKIKSIFAGANHAFAIDQQGDTWAWGLNNFGQTGVNSGAGEGEATVSPPQKVPSLAGRKMKMIAGGSHHSVGVTETGECLVWGRLDGGQSGLDLSKMDKEDSSQIILDGRDKPRILVQPTALPIPKTTYVAAGSDHCLAVTAEGKAYSWGFNATYQCGQSTEDDIIPEAKQINGKHVREEKIVWAGAGGQYGMLASLLKEN